MALKSQTEWELAIHGEPDVQVALLNGLVEDEQFLALKDYVPPFSLLGALGCSQDELTHSRLIAALFDPQVNAGAGPALRRWLQVIAGQLGNVDIAEEIRTSFETLARTGMSRVATYRERDRIDVVIEIGGVVPAVIGVENKIQAGEGRRQLASYQNALAKRYPSDRAKVLVFLTPEGREPETANRDASVPCVALGYETIAEAAEAGRQSSPDSRSPAIAEFIRHIREEIIGDAEVKDRAWSIWRNHPQALRVLLEHRPKLHHIRERLVERLSERFGEDATFTFYPSNRRDIDEIKFSRRSWASRGCDLVFVVHTQSHGDAEGRPRLRVFVRNHWYEMHRETLEDLADRVNEADGELVIDRSFQPLPHWPVWRRVLEEDFYPRSAVLSPVVLPGETEEEAVERIVHLIDRLEPHVEAMPTVDP